uniref:NADH-ubiquinone oxidoreductase chain 2 n=1 Tax=Mogannia minuta TaxID=2170271 RepID=A0A344ALT0_9HEMI|nr:NADH dehydrogenase subunit 2 [Mogannia minuta]
MKYNSSYVWFFNFLVLGIFISMNSISWLGCWLGIEINMISFLPIMLDKTNIYSSESTIKYFIVQSVGSSLLLTSIIFMDMYSMLYIMMISLMIKIGCPPFHYWYVSVIFGLKWMSSMLLMTVQKIIPMVLISYLDVELLFLMIMSGLWGSLGGLCYSSMRKIIAYSSIYNLSWIFGGMMIINYSWMLYFIIYSMSLMLICYMMNDNNINYLNQFFYSMNLYKMIISMMVLLSMGGLPPFMGFFPKFLMINCLLTMKMIFLSLFLIMTALMVLFYYLRIMMTGLLINFCLIKTLKFSLNMYFFIMSFIFIFGLVILILISLSFN